MSIIQTNEEISVVSKKTRKVQVDVEETFEEFLDNRDVSPNEVRGFQGTAAPHPVIPVKPRGGTPPKNGPAFARPTYGRAGSNHFSGPGANANKGGIYQVGR